MEAAGQLEHTLGQKRISSALPHYYRFLAAILCPIIRIYREVAPPTIFAVQASRLPG